VTDQRKLLSLLSLNVFNYVSEQTLFRAGKEVRGLQDRALESQQRLSDDSQELETRLKRRDTRTTVVVFVIGIAAALGITSHQYLPAWASSYEHWASPGFVVAGALAYIVVRASS
jgi:hypothetical protein